MTDLMTAKWNESPFESVPSQDWAQFVCVRNDDNSLECMLSLYEESMGVFDLVPSI